MSSETRFNQLVDEALAQSLSGWDFSFIEGRLLQSEPSWNYKELVKNRISRSYALLDMCTGGGEFLDGLQGLPDKTYATEGYVPNIAVAKKRLEPRGIQVVSVESDDSLPLANNEFDLIINRHGAYTPSEISRISVPDGATFITQQVGSNNATGVNEALSAAVNAPIWNLSTAKAGLVKQGFVIENGFEETPVMTFKDIGAVIFYLKAIPWQIPDFHYSNYKHKLFELHKRIESEGYFEASTHRFFIEASIG